jgi:hypothetical protein
MYEKESLKLDENGFSFVIKNSIANGHVTEVFLLSLNDVEIPFDSITINNETQSMNAIEISAENPIELKKGVSTIFNIKKDRLDELTGKEVKIHMKFKVQVRESKMMIDFDFHDVLKTNETN